MSHREELLKEVKRYCEATGLARATVATKVMNDGKFFDRIESGRNFTVRTYERVMAWFKKNSPSENSIHK